MQILEESSLSVILISFTALRLRTIHPQKNVFFFQLEGQNLSNASDPVNNNSADSARTVLYGGTIDNCILLVAWTHITLVRCLTCYSNMKLTTQLQVTHFVYASVKTTIQTGVKE